MTPCENPDCNNLTGDGRLAYCTDSCARACASPSREDKAPRPVCQYANCFRPIEKGSRSCAVCQDTREPKIGITAGARVVIRNTNCIFTGRYDFLDLCDVERDVQEAIEDHGAENGSYKIKIYYEARNESR